jgi:hypothetical protein
MDGVLTVEGLNLWRWKLMMAAGHVELSTSLILLDI